MEGEGAGLRGEDEVWTSGGKRNWGVDVRYRYYIIELRSYYAGAMPKIDDIYNPPLL